ncbi:UNVERIFIED_CONTAM: hypothetical protein Sindi_2490900 [Sesamum indicum]
MPSVLIGEASTSETKGKGSEHWRKKKGKTELATVSIQSSPVAQLGMGKGKRKAVQQSWIPKDICINCRKKGQNKRECSSSIFKMVKRSSRLGQTVLKLSNGRAIATKVMGLDRFGY